MSITAPPLKGLETANGARIQLAQWENIQLSYGFDDAGSDDDGDWDDLAAILPTNDELLASAGRHRAPQEWYQEAANTR